MKCFICVTVFFFMTFSLCLMAAGAETKLKEQLHAMQQQIDILRNLHSTDMNNLRNDFEEFKQQLGFRPSKMQDKSPDQTSIEDLRAEISEVRDSLMNNTSQQLEMQTIQNELKQALVENSELEDMVRAQQERQDRMEEEIQQLKYEHQQMKNSNAELLNTCARLTKEMHSKKKDSKKRELDPETYNDVEIDPWQQHAHHLRHQKTISNSFNKLTHDQDLLDQRVNNIQAQVYAVESRVDRYQEPNWNLLSTKVELLELETKILRTEVKNNTQKISDFDKLHASMLELREDVESIENKADKTIPEIRKEISKLDIDYAQLNAQSSYLKEDQENLRQSVKAIAVSVSNAVDRAEMDRLALHQLNESVSKLDSRAKQHFYRLNDHILKSEANSNFSDIETISLPELMGEVKELQPVESEYQDLVKQLPRDCSTVTGPPGVYLIRPGHSPIEAWCANGSTLLQRRYNGTIEFNRKFSEYVHGFGNPASEYWLGLDAMHRLTADNCSSMRIDMTDIYGGGWYAQYEYFSVGDAGSGFVLEVSGFKGNASDAFEYQNHMEFSAMDRDRDISNTHCAGNYEGGWWFSHCQHVNINGKYTLGLTWFDSVRNEWIAVATSEMRLYRRARCS